jgi:hypothetical protein
MKGNDMSGITLAYDGMPEDMARWQAETLADGTAERIMIMAIRADAFPARNVGHWVEAFDATDRTKRDLFATAQEAMKTGGKVRGVNYNLLIRRTELLRSLLNAPDLGAWSAEEPTVVDNVDDEPIAEHEVIVPAKPRKRKEMVEV